MSATSPTLDIQEQIARIDRSLAETGKLFAEQSKFAAAQRKLAAEADKFSAEQRKLFAETDKLRRDRFLAPLLAAGAVAGAVAATVSLLLRGWGVH